MLVLLPGLTRAEWVATPPALYSGELAVLRWQGVHPPDMTLGAFAGNLFFSEVNSLGPVILLGKHWNAGTKIPVSRMTS